MYKLSIHQAASADLSTLRSTQPKAAARILAVLQECQSNQDLLDRLTQHDYGRSGSAPIHVSKWLAHWNKGTDLWRFKIWDLESVGLQYRVVYVFVPGKRHYYVLAIAPRDWNYDDGHPLTQRVLAIAQDL